MQDLNKKNVATFIISFNRLKYLEILVSRLEKMGFENINILDNASSYGPLIDYLDNTPHKVIKLDKNYGHLALWKSGVCDDVINKERFILTDCDVVPVESCPDDLFETLNDLLDRNPEITKAGPALRIDNLPEASGVKEQIIEWESRFWKKRRDDGHYDAEIDTTFALYRPAIGWDEMRWWKSIRTDFPYVAEHLTWYEDINHPSAESIFYQNLMMPEASWWSLSDPAKLKKYNIQLQVQKGAITTENNELKRLHHELHQKVFKLEQKCESLAAERASLAAERASLAAEIDVRRNETKYITSSLDNYARSFSRFMPLVLTKTTSELLSTIGRVSGSAAITEQSTHIFNAYNIISGNFITIDNQPVIPSNNLKKNDYQNWIELYDTIDDTKLKIIRKNIENIKYNPLISIIMPVYKIDTQILIEAVESVKSQVYDNWQLCIADDASGSEAIERVLNKYSSEDRRINWVRRDENGNISAASNSALELATGDFVAFMDHDDLLRPHALYEVILEINKDQNVDILYTDEDHIDNDGKRSNPYFKSDWNFDKFLTHNLLNHLTVIRRELVSQVGGFRLGFEGSQDYDLALRILNSKNNLNIKHIPKVLYHWRQGAAEASFSEKHLSKCADAAVRAKEDFFKSQRIDAKVAAHPLVSGWQKISWPAPQSRPLVSIIVPTKNREDLLSQCVNSILDKTNYENYEIIIVDHESYEEKTIQLLKELKENSRIKIISYSGEFNYSDINNKAAAHARGEYICLLNNDTEVISEDWMMEMLSICARDEVGIVGAKLLYPDGRVQHAGVVTGIGGVAGHVNKGLARDEYGYCGSAVAASEVSAVTGACLLIKKSVFDEVGGLDAQHLAVAFNDVDLCLKVGARGYKIIWTPFALLYHHESPSRGADSDPDKVDRFNSELYHMRHKWRKILENDKFYNPNLSLSSEHFHLAFPPRLPPFSI